MGEGNGEEVLKQLEVAAREIGVVSEQIPFAIERVDQTMFDKMSEGARKTVTDAAAKTRRDIARAALQTPISFTSEEGAIEEQTLLDRLKSDYNVRYYRFARDTEELVDLDAVIAGAVSDTTEQKPERALTDLTGALEHVLENTSPESTCWGFVAFGWTAQCRGIAGRFVAANGSSEFAIRCRSNRWVSGAGGRFAFEFERS